MERSLEVWRGKRDQYGLKALGPDLLEEVERRQILKLSNIQTAGPKQTMRAVPQLSRFVTRQTWFNLEMMRLGYYFLPSRRNLLKYGLLQFLRIQDAAQVLLGPLAVQKLIFRVGRKDYLMIAPKKSQNYILPDSCFFPNNINVTLVQLAYSVL